MSNLCTFNNLCYTFLLKRKFIIKMKSRFLSPNCVGIHSFEWAVSLIGTHTLTRYGLLSKHFHILIESAQVDTMGKKEHVMKTANYFIRYRDRERSLFLHALGIIVIFFLLAVRNANIKWYQYCEWKYCRDVDYDVFGWKYSCGSVSVCKIQYRKSETSEKKILLKAISYLEL